MIPPSLSALQRCTSATAIGGGLLLVAAALVTLADVVGRKLFSLSLLGAFEFLQIAIGLSIFCFLPHCQLSGGNIAIHLFSRSWPKWLLNLSEASANLLYAVFAALLLARGWERASDLWNYGETTQMLAYPLWLSFVIVLPVLALLLWTCLFCLLAPAAVASYRQRSARPLMDGS